MKEMLVVGRLKEGKFEKFMGFMQSDKGMDERKKVADVTKTIGAVSPDKKAVMFKIFVHNIDAMHAFVDGSNPVTKPVWDEVMESFEIFELKNHPWFIGVQFHPEFKSRPFNPHPLFSSFVKAVKIKQKLYEYFFHSREKIYF